MSFSLPLSRSDALRAAGVLPGVGAMDASVHPALMVLFSRILRKAHRLQPMSLGVEILMTRYTHESFLEMADYDEYNNIVHSSPPVLMGDAGIFADATCYLQFMWLRRYVAGSFQAAWVGEHGAAGTIPVRLHDTIHIANEVKEFFGDMLEQARSDAMVCYTFMMGSDDGWDAELGDITVAAAMGSRTWSAWWYTSSEVIHGDSGNINDGLAIFMEADDAFSDDSTIA